MPKRYQTGKLPRNPKQNMTANFQVRERLRNSNSYIVLLRNASEVPGWETVGELELKILLEHAFEVPGG